MTRHGTKPGPRDHLPCPACKGTGTRFRFLKCEYCNGGGRITRARAARINQKRITTRKGN